MPKTESTMLALGTKAPHFELPDPRGGTVRLDQFAQAPGLVVMFICNHCPFVKHLQEGLAKFGVDYAAKRLAVVAINSNDVGASPADGPEAMAEDARRLGYTFPYLFDATQAVAKAYRAACTPDFFLFDREHRLVYRGQFDPSRPGNSIPVTGEDLRAACDAVLASRPVGSDQKPSIGCNIKWRAGNAPEYFAA